MSLIVFIRDYDFFFYFAGDDAFFSYNKYGTHTFLMTAFTDTPVPYDK